MTELRRFRRRNPLTGKADHCIETEAGRIYAYATAATRDAVFARFLEIRAERKAWNDRFDREEAPTP